jgi:hypothetical protein
MASAMLLPTRNIIADLPGDFVHPSPRSAEADDIAAQPSQAPAPHDVKGSPAHCS